VLSSRPTAQLPTTAGVIRAGRRDQVSRFVGVGVASALLDLAALRILYGTIGLALPLATLLAFVAAFLMNFSLSRHWTFDRARSGRTRVQLARYFALVAINLIATIVIVTGMTALGINYLPAKVISIVSLAIGNFIVYRDWVFR
jgi:putative flippase GtrA